MQAVCCILEIRLHCMFFFLLSMVLDKSVVIYIVLSSIFKLYYGQDIHA